MIATKMVKSVRFFFGGGCKAQIGYVAQVPVLKTVAE